jgi:pseudouridylate synthase
VTQPAPLVLGDSLALAHGVRAERRRAFLVQACAQLEVVGARLCWPVLQFGTLRLDLDAEALHSLLGQPIRKIAAPQLGAATTLGWTGGLTVSALLMVARQHGATLALTGGLGGIHPGQEPDVSADLAALAHGPVPLLACGLKPILDVSATQARLETLGIPVLGLETDNMPLLATLATGDPLFASFAHAQHLAAAIAAHRQHGGIASPLIVCAPEGPDLLAADEMAEVRSEALEAAAQDAVSGAALTPFLIRYLIYATQGRWLRANEQSLATVVAVAARIVGGWTSHSPTKTVSPVS